MKANESRLIFICLHLLATNSRPGCRSRRSWPRPPAPTGLAEPSIASQADRLPARLRRGDDRFEDLDVVEELVRRETIGFLAGDRRRPGLEIGRHRVGGLKRRN